MINRFLYILCIYCATYSCAQVFKKELSEYLKQQMEYVNRELDLHIPHHIFPREVEKRAEFHTVVSKALPRNYISAHSFTVFNDTYILLDMELYYVTHAESKLILNQSPKFHKFEDEVSFVKTIEYNNFGILLVCFKNGMSNIYTHTKDSKERLFVQSIQNPEIIQDASFFINKKSLYLIISTTQQYFLMPTTVYKWKGTYFDEIDKILTRGLTGFLTFPNMNSEIIVLIQNSNNHERSTSVSYEFNEKRLKKIQLLNTRNPKHILSYLYENKRYIIIFDEVSYNIYWWDDMALISFAQFYAEENIEVTLLSYVKNIPIIFVGTKSKLLVYSPTASDIKLLTSWLYDEPLKRIFDLKMVHYNNKDVIFTFGQTNEDKLKFSVLHFKLYLTEIVSKINERDPVLECTAQLERKLLDRQSELNLLEKKSEQITKINEPARLYEKPSVEEPVVAQASFINKEILSEKYQQYMSEIQRKIDLINDKISELLPKIEELFKPGTAVVNGKLIVKGGLHARRMEAKNLMVDKLNSVDWKPERWLTYSTPQIINGHFEAKDLRTDKLHIPVKGTVFDNLLLANGNQKIKGPATFNSLTATNLYTPAINGILFDDIYLRSQPKVVQGLKQFENISVDNIKMTYLNEHNASDIIKLFADPKSHQYVFGPNVNITNLYVESINNIHWDTFKNSVFQIGKNNRITGNLTISGAQIDRLYAQKLNGLEVDKFLTTTTDQIITSSMKFNNVDANNIYAKTINGIEFEKEVVTINDGGNNLIKGPVIIDNIHILGDYHVNGIDKSNFHLDGNHIIGTDKNDLLQMYNKVKITGNVHIENLLLANDSKVIVNGTEFYMDQLKDYWLINTPQVIPVHVEMQNGITTPHLSTKMLNGIDIDKYMVNNLEENLPTHFHFKNITVLGNITIDPTKEHSPNIRQIDEEAVKLSGNYTIKGRKTFTGKLTTDNVHVNNLSGINVKEVVNINTEYISGQKRFQKLIIKGNLSADTAEVDVLNGEVLNEMYDKYVLVDTPAHFEKVDFKNITVENLEVYKINNEIFNEYVSLVDSLHNLKTLGTLNVTDNVEIENVRNLLYINGVNLKELAKNNSNSLVKGNIKFMDKVRVKDLIVSNINGVDIKYLQNNLLYRHWSQEITSKLVFRSITTPNLHVPQINDVDLTNLINIEERDPQILKVTNLQLTSPKFLKSLNVNGNLPCDINEVVSKLHNPSIREWGTINVLQNVTILNEEDRIYKLLKYAVTTNRDNIITAPVTFSNVYADTVVTERHINNINLEEIYRDALLKHEHDQLITGFKEFGNLTVAGATVTGNAELPVINKIIITELNDKIIHKNDIYNGIITGEKIFTAGLETKALNTPFILGLQPENLVSLSNLRPIPQATFESLHVLHNMDMEFINGINFTDFLSRRLLKESPVEQFAHGTYFFDSIQLNADSIIPTINEINMEDVIFDVGEQTIPSEKHFFETVEIYGDIEVDLVNGVNLRKEYENSILANEDATIEGDIKFTNIVELNNNIIAKKINNIPVDDIKEMLESDAPKVKANIVYDIIGHIEDRIQETSETINNLPDMYMYVEKTSELQITLPNTVNAQAIESKGHIMLHILGEEPGYVCGLPNSCNCPVQHTVQITPEYSVHVFANKDAQRIYSYETDIITLHVITNSISSSLICRQNASILNEHTFLTWNTAYMRNETGNSYIYPEQINGYVTGAEFFTIDGIIYAIINTFYNAALNTHNLECLVLRFTKQMDNVEVVQKIRTRGSWSIHLFHTAQGINLIIGNIFDSEQINSGTSTDIYQFDVVLQKFMLLRIVLGAGSISSTDVVLGLDSFIILAQKESTFLVLKYNHDYNNYYFYQSFVMDSPVLSVSKFYIGYGISDAYLCAVTEANNFFIYSYKYIEGWKLQSQGELDGLRALIPFDLNEKTYLFAPSTHMSSLLTVIKHSYI